ncbi:MAG TPA: iron chelate uptake ABC transporter family permease subunit [Roseiflexaceae bacterium]|nr:iron chelate uptake ABC transporter family permease subunit [Roseiflexaceae bacterium]
MDLIGLLSDMLFDYTLRTVALGAATLGIVSGMLGSYAVLRKQSLLGDAMSHAALPGIALAFLFTGSKAPFVLLLGAALAGWVGTLLVMSIVKTTRIKNDSALGLILSVFFGFGLMLLTYIQRLPNATQAGLDKFLFGQAATLLVSDVIIMAALGTLALLIMMVFWKEFKLLSFDPDFGATLGLPIRVLDVLLTTLLVVAIVLGLQTVGVVLMSAMVVAPAAAARQWTNRLGVMIGLAGLFGGLAGVSGAMISSSAAHLPTGPTIVLSVSTIVVVSLLLAPNRGLLWQSARRRRNRRRLRVEAVLSDLYALASQHERMDHGHSIAVLRAMSVGRGGVRRSLEELAARGWARPVTGEAWVLTPQGRAEAERMMGQREA